MRTLLALTLAVSAALPAATVASTDAPQPHFNRLHHPKEVTAYLQQYAKAYPGLVQLKSIGKSSLGEDIWLLSIYNAKTGAMEDKPAAYIDAATHANEIQTTEAALYTIDFVLKNYGKLAAITELVDRASLHFVPTVSVDSRRKWFDEPSTPNAPRTTQWPFDDDRDGRVDEDAPVDLNGDGIITTMRKKVPAGTGQFKLDPKDARRLLPVEPGEAGDYIMLGNEGVDSDGDGRIAEDGIGYADPNRSWAYDWAPRYIQGGATDYPLQLPETRSIANWALTQPQIGVAISLHNAGRMILRGPGSPTQTPVSARDERVFDFLGREGEKMLPGYRYMITWRDLYTAYGSTTDHFYGVHGAYGFVMELFGAVLDKNSIQFHRPPPAPGERSAERDADNDNGASKGYDTLKWNDMLTFGRQFVPFKPAKHPQFGDIEIGGWREDTGRSPESWMLEEEHHRNAAYILFNAGNLPKLRFLDASVRRVDGKLWRVEVPVVNERAIPSISDIALTNRLHRHDVVTVSGARVRASGVVRNTFTEQIDLQSDRPERLLVPGVPGHGHTRLYFLVEGSGEISINYDSLKGGKLSTRVQLK